jgi:signal peptidase I
MIKDRAYRLIRQVLDMLGDFSRNLLLALGILLFVVAFLVQPVRVEGTSMEPELADQERVFINKFSYRVFEIERGDVVVFSFPGDVRKSFIKRVIALPGETLTIKQGNVYIDNALLTESYIPPEFQSHTDLGPVTVPADHYFVMGDHRSVSNDSRHWGPLHRRFIYGKAMLKYWPLNDIGLVY